MYKNDFTQYRAVEKWFKCWKDLWKLNSVPHVAAATFAGEDGDILKEMLSLFKVNTNVFIKINYKYLQSYDELFFE